MPSKIIENVILYKQPNTSIFQWEIQWNFYQKAEINENKKKFDTLDKRIFVKRRQTWMSSNSYR